MKLANLEGKVLAERFRLESKLGEGGYGAVFEAVQLSVGRRCAVKVLFPHLCDDDATVQRFRTEARTTSRLTHPNSVVIYDFGRDEELDLLFLAMELLDGNDLRSVIRTRGWLGVDETVHVVCQAAGSLQEAHDLGLVHRDIKPHNIMLLERGSDASFVKVIDFGIAKVVRNSLMTVSDVTRTGTIIGTPKYMSPEQIRDSSIDGRTDMYGLAISAYQMLIGRTPFEEGTALEIAARQIAEKPEPLRTFRPNLAVNDRFEAVLLKALEKKPRDRFDSVTEFALALEEAAATTSRSRALSRQTPTPVDGVVAVPGTVSDGTSSTGTSSTRPESVPTSLLEPHGLGRNARDEAGFVQDYDEITQGPEAPFFREGLEPPLPAGVSPERTDERLPTEAESTGAVAIADDGDKTLATLAISNPAMAKLDDGHARDGTTAEVKPHQDDEGEAASAPEAKRPPRRVLSRVPVVVSAVLALLVGVGLWLVSAGMGEPDARTKVTGDDAAMGGEEALTVSVQTEPLVNPTPQVAPEPEPEAEPETETEPETEEASEPDPEQAPEPEPKLGSEQEAEPEAEPSPPTRTRRGKVEVRVIPWGTLFVNGRRVGEGTRHELRLREGRHRLVLKQSGQVRAQRSVDVSSRSSKIIELVAK